MILAFLLLLSGISISIVAEYYSIMGLMAIFAAAPIPIAIMGIVLGVGKLVQATWLKAYWTRLPFTMKSYGILSVCILMLITTLGCFGYLSKAHSDQTLVSGDVQSKIAIYDEKIKTEKENIEANRKALKQLDEGVDQVLGRSTSETGAERAVALRRSQQKERARLQAEISQSQKSIAELNDARAPIAAEIRKVEAEVGPIKYIAAFVYGDNPDASILERAVTWVIVLIVVVFDPLAVVMLLAAQMTYQWARDNKEDPYDDFVADAHEQTIDKMIEQDEQQLNEIVEQVTDVKPESAPPAYLSQPFVHFENLKPMVAPKAEPEPKLETTPFNVVDNGPNWTLIPSVDQHALDRLQQELNESKSDIYELVNYAQSLQQDYASVSDLHQKSMTREANLIEEVAQLKEELAHAIAVNDDHAAMSINPEPIGVTTRPFTEEEIAALDKPEVYAGNPDDFKEPWSEEDKTKLVEAMQDIFDKNKESQEDSAGVASMAPINTQPEILTLGIDVVDRPGDYLDRREPETGFGNAFPNNPTRGDLYLRTDFRPSRLFKWNDQKWLEVSKKTTTAYAYNDAYIQFLAEQISSGNYTYDDLTETEMEQVQSVIGGQRG